MHIVMTAVTCQYANVPVMSVYDSSHTAVFNHVHQMSVSF